jgi:hypothetical protein
LSRLDCRTIQPVERTPGLTTLRQKFEGTAAEDATTADEEATSDEESTIDDGDGVGDGAGVTETSFELSSTDDTDEDGDGTGDGVGVTEISLELSSAEDTGGVDAAETTVELMGKFSEHAAPVNTPNSMTKSVGVFVVKSSVPNR